MIIIAGYVRALEFWVTDRKGFGRGAILLRPGIAWRKRVSRS